MANANEDPGANRLHTSESPSKSPTPEAVDTVDVHDIGAEQTSSALEYLGTPAIPSKSQEYIPEPVDVSPKVASMQREPQSTGLDVGNPIDASSLAEPHASWAQSPLFPPLNIIVHLVEVYFESIQPEFPLLHRPSLLEGLYSGSLLTERHSPLLLNALFSLASKFTDDPQVHSFDLSLAQCLSGAESPRTAHTRKTSRRERGRGFSRRAGELFEDTTHEYENLELDANIADKPSILLIQGAILLSYAELSRGAVHRAYSLISKCVRAAYDAGLDRIDSAENLQSVDPILYHQTTDWRKEELRRAWWCIWELESFVCNILCRTQITNLTNCQTKLPMDDMDWYEGIEIPSYFLPNSFEQWSRLDIASPHISILAHRIVALHFLLAIVGLEGKESSDLSTAYSEIERCVTIWRKSLPPEFTSLSQVQNCPDYLDSFSKRLWIYVINEEITLFTAKTRMFEGFNDATAPDYCQSYSKWLSSRIEQDRYSMRPSQSLKFFESIRASDNICGAIKHCPSHIIHRSSPLIVVSLWAPACIQFLVKIFATSNGELRDKASLSLQTLVSAMEQFQEYSGLCQIVLSLHYVSDRKALSNCHHRTLPRVHAETQSF
ncbi:fungal-specific transcription factor domain-containing protein [Trichoderma sp. SZMC 28011]